LGVSRIHPKRPDSDPSDLLVAAELLLRQVPEEEEDEEEDDRKKENDDDFDTTDDGYSERPSASPVGFQFRSDSGPQQVKTAADF
jgi:hypothetical protein